jgi:hypothetical protein
MTIGVKLHQELSLDEFCDNIVAQIPEYGYLNAEGAVLNKSNRAELVKQNYRCFSPHL